MFRYPRTNNRNVIQNEDEIENFHFRRRPTSFLCSNDPKRFTWMAAEQEAAIADGTRYENDSKHIFRLFLALHFHFDFEKNRVGVFHFLLLIIRLSLYSEIFWGQVAIKMGFSRIFHPSFFS